MKKHYCLCYIISLMLLTSCSTVSGWFGDKPTEKMKGERVSVFKLESALHPDSALQNTPVVLPAIGTLEHLQLAGDLTKKSEISIGAGTGDVYELGSVPLVSEGVMYTLDAKGSVSAYEAASVAKDKPVWRTNVITQKGKVFAGGGMAAAGGKIFVTIGSEEIIVLNAVDGKILWRKAMGNVIRAAPLAVAGAVFVMTIDNHLYAMSAADGRVAWMHAGETENIGVFGAAPPILTANWLIVPYSSGELYALNPTNGQEGWIGNLAYNKGGGTGIALNDIDAALVISNNVLYAAGNAGVLYAVNALSGERLWHQEVGGVRGIWVAGDYLYVIAGNNEVICLQAQKGVIKWVAQLPRYEDEKGQKNKIVLNGPVLASERILVSASNGVLYSLSPYDGKITQKISVPDHITLPPIVALGDVYLLSNSAKLTVLH